MKPRIIIGIDPDCSASGIAIIDKESQYMVLDVLPFPNLINLILKIEHNFVVIVEAGWLIKSNWHIKANDSKSVSSAKGNSVGRNHETGRKIVEMLKYHNINVIEQRPLQKCWKGKDRKITHEEISKIIPNFPPKSNQENRDAALIAWTFKDIKI